MDDILVLAPHATRGCCDEDVLIFHPSGPIWALLHDGSAEVAALAAADVEAVALPEPRQLLMLSSGLGFLLGLGRRRIRR